MGLARTQNSLMPDENTLKAGTTPANSTFTVPKLLIQAPNITQGLNNLNTEGTVTGGINFSNNLNIVNVNAFKGISGRRLLKKLLNSSPNLIVYNGSNFAGAWLGGGADGRWSLGDVRRLSKESKANARNSYASFTLNAPLVAAGNTLDYAAYLTLLYLLNNPNARLMTWNAFLTPAAPAAAPATTPEVAKAPYVPENNPFNNTLSVLDKSNLENAVSAINNSAAIKNTPWELTKYGKAAIAAGYKDRNAVMALLKSLDFAPGHGLDGAYGNNTIAREQALKNAGYTYKNGVWTNLQGLPWKGAWNGNLIINQQINDQLQNDASIEPGPMYSYFEYLPFDKPLTEEEEHINEVEAARRRQSLGIKGIRFSSGEKLEWNGRGIKPLPGGYEYQMNNGILQRRLRKGAWEDVQGYSTYKVGGSIQKHQQGGTMSQEDQLEQMLTYATLGMIGYANSLKQPMDFTTAVSLVMELAQSKPEALQEIASNKELIQAGLEIMKQQEPDTLLIISQPGGMRKILALLLQLKTTMAKNGTKLNYIKELKNICPEGYEVSYMKAGSKMCPVCKKKMLKAEQGVELDKCGSKVKKHSFGGVTSVMNDIVADIFKCGGKTKIKKNENPSGPLKKPALKPLNNPAKKPIIRKDDNAEYLYPDSATFRRHGELLDKIKKDAKSLTPQEMKELRNLNKYLTVSD